MSTQVNLSSTNYGQFGRLSLETIVSDATSWLFHIGRHRIGEVLTSSFKPLSNVLEVRFGLFRAHKSNEAAQIAAPDAVVVSYGLTRSDISWEQIILDVKSNLQSGGKIAIVDFHDSPSSFFRYLMGYRNVDVDKNILPFLHAHFSLRQFEIRPACFGLWNYFIYIGETKSAAITTFEGLESSDDFEYA